MTYAPHFSNKSDYYYLRKKLRRDQTPAEKRLWKYIRAEQLGYKFRRQFQIAFFIVDFYCHSLKLVIELDGEYHATPQQRAYDTRRDGYLRASGYTVLRFTNDDVGTNIEHVIDVILQTATKIKQLR